MGSEMVMLQKDAKQREKGTEPTEMLAETTANASSCAILPHSTSLPSIPPHSVHSEMEASPRWDVSTQSRIAESSLLMDAGASQWRSTENHNNHGNASKAVDGEKVKTGSALSAAIPIRDSVFPATESLAPPREDSPSFISITDLAVSTSSVLTDMKPISASPVSVPPTVLKEACITEAEAVMAKPQAGTLLEGRYRLLKKIGSGGTADVYLAEHVSLGNAWAVKILSHADSTLQEHLKEADILKRLNHPMLPRIADIIRTETHTCIVMDYLEGGNLLERLETKGRIPERDVLAWMLQICDVLIYLHNQQPAAIIYRDLKPSNLIADDFGHLKLVDFGTARAYQAGGEGDTAYIGTQGYAAPEQYGINQSDGRTDLYNLGMTMFHLLSGIHPVTVSHGELEDVLRTSGVSPRLSTVVLGCVKLSPSQRYQNANACRNALLEVRNQTHAEPVFVGLQGASGTRPDGLPAPARQTAEVTNPTPLPGFPEIIRKRKRSSPILPAQARIAVMAACPGAGATFACIALSSLFTLHRYDTAFIELNQSGDLARLRSTLVHAGHLAESGMDSGTGSFRFGSVDYHLGCRKLSDIQTRRYDVALADMGSRCGGHAMDEFLRADWQFIYCPQADWKLGRITEFMETFDADGKENRFQYLFPMEGEGDARLLRSIFGKRKAHVFPQIRNPFEPGRQEIHQMERLLRNAGLA